MQNLGIKSLRDNKLKSRLTRKMFIRDIIDFGERQKLKVKIILNSLEESENKVISTLVANDIYKKYGVQINYFELNNFALTPMSDELDCMVQSARESINDYEKYVDIIHIGNPTGVYKYVIDYLFTSGTFLKNGTPLKEVKYRSDEWDTYIPNDPSEIVIVISDTINKYQAENNNTHYQSLRTFSEFYSRNLLGLRCGVISVIIQQQKGSKEAIDTNFRGTTIIEKLKPSLDALADNTGTQQDATLILGLFNPVKFGDNNYGGYPDLTNLTGKFRVLSVLKTREGELEANNEIPLYCQLGIDEFTEMPKPHEKELLKQFYK